MCLRYLSLVEREIYPAYDDEDDAWKVALRMLEADRAMGMGHRVTVRKKTVRAGKERVYVIVILDPAETSGFETSGDARPGDRM